MSSLTTLVAKVFVVVSLACGRMPRVIALLDLFHQPSIARVIIIRRRQLTYAEFFSAKDRDGRRAAPIAYQDADVLMPEPALQQSSESMFDRTYIPVRTA